MQNPFRIACRTGRIDRKSCVMDIRRHEPCKGLRMHYNIPVALVKFRHTPAVPANISNALRSISVLNERPGRPCFPHSDHGNDRKNASRQIYKDKVFLADSLFTEPGVHLTGHLVKLRISNSFRMRIIKQNRHIRVLFSILMQYFQYSGHTFPPLDIQLSLHHSGSFSSILSPEPASAPGSRLHLLFHRSSGFRLHTLC